MGSRRKVFMVISFILVLFVFFQIFYMEFSQSRWNSLSSFSILSSFFGNEHHRNRIFCMILTQPKNLATKAKAVYETWAYKCDYHRFISVIPELYSNMTVVYDEPGSTRKELHLKYSILQPNGLTSESYKNLTRKVLLSLIDIYENFGGKFDWFLKADDDTFIFVDNLRTFLSNKSHLEPQTFGYNFKRHVEKGYHSGGAGYVLSADSFSKLSETIKTNFTYCRITGTEDVDIARCLRRLNVTPGRSDDDLGRERFHPLTMKGHYSGKVPRWLNGYAANPPKFGLECCSDQVISFHYMSSKNMYKIAEFIQNNTRWTFQDIVDELLVTATKTTNSQKRAHKSTKKSII